MAKSTLSPPFPKMVLSTAGCTIQSSESSNSTRGSCSFLHNDTGTAGRGGAGKLGKENANKIMLPSCLTGWDSCAVEGRPRGGPRYTTIRIFSAANRNAQLPKLGQPNTAPRGRARRFNLRMRDVVNGRCHGILGTPCFGDPGSPIYR